MDQELRTASGFESHELTRHDLPCANVFLGDLQVNQHWTHAASRELLQLLVNPIIGRVVYREMGDATNHAYRLYLHDITAPCARYEHGYEVGGWVVSNFVHEAWFSHDGKVPKPSFDHEGRIRHAFGILPGERVFAYDLGTRRWLAIGADERTGHVSEIPMEPDRLGARRLAEVVKLVGSGSAPYEAVPGGP